MLFNCLQFLRDGPMENLLSSRNAPVGPLRRFQHPFRTLLDEGSHVDHFLPLESLYGQLDNSQCAWKTWLLLSPFRQSPRDSFHILGVTIGRLRWPPTPPRS
jgi:hypothetical protein